MNVKNFILLMLAAYLSLLSTIFVVFDMPKYFVAGLMVLILLLVFAVVVVVKLYKGRHNAYALSAVFFSAMLLNSALLYCVLDVQFSLFAVMILSALFGSALSVEKLSTTSGIRSAYSSGPIVKDIPKIMSDVYNIIEESKKYDIKAGSNKKAGAADKRKSVTEKKQKLAKKYSPGKFIASVAGTKYHSPKCDWAKKISKKNIVWLKDKSDAVKQGYKPCNCMK